uniref:EGF-like domain-containing protein n=1 Tax=Strigamia maritima TaxID=126957 RepID=T1IJC6_STRMM
MDRCNQLLQGEDYLIAYSGTECDMAICHMCLNGFWASPYHCVCHSGWKGYNCDKAICFLIVMDVLMENALNRIIVNALLVIMVLIVKF